MTAGPYWSIKPPIKKKKKLTECTNWLDKEDTSISLFRYFYTNCTLLFPSSTSWLNLSSQVADSRAEKRFANHASLFLAKKDITITPVSKQLFTLCWTWHFPLIGHSTYNISFQ